LKTPNGVTSSIQATHLSRSGLTSLNGMFTGLVICSKNRDVLSKYLVSRKKEEAGMPDWDLKRLGSGNRYLRALGFG
jgi:hypothetical protein